jgi:hypothetical protein
LPPTPGSSARRCPAVPATARADSRALQDAGEPTEPAQDDFLARLEASPGLLTRTDLQARPFSSSTRSTSTPVSTVRLGRWRIGLRNALAAFQRTPAFWLTWK